MSQQVLVLNGNFEPLNVCDIRRALNLVICEKAALVANGRGMIHTSNQAYPLPSVIRLKKMVHRPRQKIKPVRCEIFRRDNYTCQYCGRHTPVLTIDHIVPKHMGGTQTWENSVTACPSCNHRKGGRTLQETGMHLLRIPKVPPNSAEYIFSRYLKENNEWEPYINGW
jgi:5-methylcytosine-specific restriction endonuclease McrA